MGSLHSRLRGGGLSDQRLVVPMVARQRRQSLAVAGSVRGVAAGTRIALVGSLTAAPGKEAQSGSTSSSCR
jgi:hypothetical protein